MPPNIGSIQSDGRPAFFQEVDFEISEFDFLWERHLAAMLSWLEVTPTIQANYSLEHYSPP